MLAKKIYTPLLTAALALSVACTGRGVDPNTDPDPDPDAVVDPDPDPDPVVDPDPDPDPEGPFFDGCQVSTLYRDPDSGFPVYRVTYTLDDDDNMVGYEYDEGPDEDIDYRQGSEFDETGRITATLIDADGDDVLEETYRYEYFDTGEFAAQVYEADADQDGVVDTTTRFELDREGRFTGSETDLDADGDADQLMTLAYEDVTGRLLSIDTDEDADGVVDNRTTYTYALDCQGQTPAETFPVPDRCALLTQEDLDDDGTIDNLERSTFDDEGRVLTAERDEGNDGDFTLTYEAEYDAEGRLTLERLDEDDNGVLETERTYAYDGELTTIHEERFDNETGTITSAFDYTVDETGASIGGYTGSYDTDGDGALDLTELNEQDHRGITTGLSYDLNLDGTPDYTYTIDILDECVTSI
jgi:hypothetical protein